KQAYAMVAYLGMSDEIPNICYYGNEEYSFNKPYSEKTAEQIDVEVRKLIAEQYERAKRILSEHKEGHAQMVELLMDKEMILTDDVERILGKRKWLSRSEELILATEKSNKEKESKQSESSQETDNTEKPKVETETENGL
ncbi:MAG: cell division protein FtsH, partial [Bacteroides sp.]|nr:cell division protein FtsH [Bacteroides sp.]